MLSERRDEIILPHSANHGPFAIKNFSLTEIRIRDLLSPSTKSGRLTICAIYPLTQVLFCKMYSISGSALHDISWYKIHLTNAANNTEFSSLNCLANLNPLIKKLLEITNTMRFKTQGFKQWTCSLFNIGNLYLNQMSHVEMYAIVP